MARGVWGVDIRSLDTGERLYELNAGRLMMPASNMKIVTLAAAADTLGWDYRFTTTLETTGADRSAASLKGDLIVRGGGDPTINTRDGRAAAVLDEWAAALTAAGIQQIDGADHRRRPALRRRGHRPGVGVGLPAVRLRRAGRRAAVQREPGDADRPPGRAGGRAGQRSR